MEKDGSLVPYQSQVPQKPAQPLTKHQRVTLYFKALRYVRSMLKSVGFHDETDIGHSGFSISLDGFLLEMVAKEPPPMAHVTSCPGYQYDPKQINARVTMMTPGDGHDYVIQVVATPPNAYTDLPVFIVVRPDSPDPLKEAFINCLMVARDMLRKSPRTFMKVQAAMAKRDIEQELEKLKAQDESQALPPSPTKHLGY